jgi:hypothetical protein
MTLLRDPVLSPLPRHGTSRDYFPYRVQGKCEAEADHHGMKEYGEEAVAGAHREGKPQKDDDEGLIEVRIGKVERRIERELDEGVQENHETDREGGEEGKHRITKSYTLYLDPAVIGHAIAPYRARYAAMAKTFSTPFVGNYIRFLGAFPIPEANGLRKLIKPIKELIDEGWLVHFFPEGDLTYRNQQPRPFSPGVFFYSQLLDRPVIPVTIVLLPAEFFGRRLTSRFFRVKVVIDEPIYPAAFRTAGRNLRDAVEAMACAAHRVISDRLRVERASCYRFPSGLPASGLDGLPKPCKGLAASVEAAAGQGDMRPINW